MNLERLIEWVNVLAWLILIGVSLHPACSSYLTSRKGDKYAFGKFRWYFLWSMCLAWVVT